MSVIMLLLSLTIATSRRNNLEIFAMGDWGGQQDPPYTTPFQLNTVKIMGEIGNDITVDQVLGLGDNVYDIGVRNEYDSRFQTTFENVFTAKSLTNIPFYMLAGNHDWYGNVSGQIYYSNHSKRWSFSDYWYTLKFKIRGIKGIAVEVLMIDTIILSGLVYSSEYCEKYNIDAKDCSTQPMGTTDPIKAKKQWKWINQTMKDSTASYLLVAGHYPIYSIAEHGSTVDLVQNLNPLMKQYNAQAYISGHDHTFQYIEAEGIGYIDTGGAHLCEDSTDHMDTIPPGSLQFHGCDSGGFTRIKVNSTGMFVYYYFGSSKKIQYQTQFTPRN